MTIRELTAYQVVCDHCGGTAYDMDAEYPLSDDAGDANEAWIDADGIAVDDRHACHECGIAVLDSHPDLHGRGMGMVTATMPEPTYVGAIVVDRNGHRWVAHADGSYMLLDDIADADWLESSYGALVDEHGAIREETPTERARRGAPAVLPAGHIAIALDAIPAHLRTTDVLRGYADELLYRRSVYAATICDIIADAIDAQQDQS